VFRPVSVSARVLTSVDDFSQERLLRLFTKAPGAFWRHDVDVSLAAAVKMARFAQVAGVVSTFFLNPRCDFYNLFSREGEQAVAAILDAGHKLGVHVDYRDGSVMDRVSADRILATTGLGPVFTARVSFHMPPQRVLWADFDGFDSAYASEWENRYLSDSRRSFGPLKEATITEDMQVNLHPEHWFA
jgi:hypothetical protein